MPRYYPYMTVEEMRSNAHILEQPPKDGGGSRFSDGSTHPPLALKYFPKDGRILECGPLFGMFTKFLQDEGYNEIHTLDIVDQIHFPDRKRLTSHIIDLSMEKFPYPDGHFDGVTAWGIGEHLENPFHFMREIHRVLKPNTGICLLSLPNEAHILSKLMFLRNGIFPRWHPYNNHIMLLPKGVIEKTIFRYFDLIETAYLVRTPHFYRRPDRRTGRILRLLNKAVKRFPASEWSGDYVVYSLQKKPFIPYTTLPDITVR